MFWRLASRYDEESESESEEEETFGAMNNGMKSKYDLMVSDDKVNLPIDVCYYTGYLKDSCRLPQAWHLTRFCWNTFRI